jgi:hypothetical protein
LYNLFSRTAHLDAHGYTKKRRGRERWRNSTGERGKTKKNAFTQKPLFFVFGRFRVDTLRLRLAERGTADQTTNADNNTMAEAPTTPTPAQPRKPKFVGKKSARPTTTSTIAGMRLTNLNQILATPRPSFFRFFSLFIFSPFSLCRRSSFLLSTIAPAPPP